MKVCEATQLNNQFGYGRFKPECLQVLNKSPYLLLSLCFCAICQGSIVNGFISTSITSLEKRFNLTSMQSGLFCSFYDIAIVFALLPLSHYGNKCHKGRVIAYGMLILGLGSISITIPHFLADNYTVSQQKQPLCGVSSVAERCGESASSANNDFWYFILLLSQLCIGFGAAPLFTLGISFIDENVSQKTVAIYLGIYMAISTVGPAIGFIVNGQLLKIWGDIGKTNYKLLGITGVTDSRWYGAWWIGFLATGFFCCIVSLPLFGFPKELPEKERHRSKDIKQTDRRLDKDYGVALSALPKIILDMIKNPSLLCLMCMQIIESFLMNGFITFIPKIFESLFAYSASYAATIAGLLVIPVGLFGCLFGAVIAKRTQRYRPTIALAILFNICALLLTFVFLYEYYEHEAFNGQNSVLTTKPLRDLSCNVNCNCDNIYDPVCDFKTSTSYYSPCYAGCQIQVQESDVDDKLWQLCRCLLDNKVSNKSALSSQYDKGSGTIVKGLCKTRESSNVTFFVLFALLCFFTFSSVTPIQNAFLRLVSFETRDTGICLNWLLMRIFGSIPGAVIFGFAIDQTCSLWKEECGAKQSCLLYYPGELSRIMFLFAVLLKFVIILLLMGSYCFYIPTPNDIVQISKIQPMKARMQQRNANADSECREKCRIF